MKKNNSNALFVAKILRKLRLKTVSRYFNMRRHKRITTTLSEIFEETNKSTPIDNSKRLDAHKIVRFFFAELNIKKHIKPVAVIAGIIFMSTIYNKVDVTMLKMLSTDEAMIVMVSTKQFSLQLVI